MIQIWWHGTNFHLPFILLLFVFVFEFYFLWPSIHYTAMRKKNIFLFICTLRSISYCFVCMAFSNDKRRTNWNSHFLCYDHLFYSVEGFCCSLLTLIAFFGSCENILKIIVLIVLLSAFAFILTYSHEIHIHFTFNDFHIKNVTICTLNALCMIRESMLFVAVKLAHLFFWHIHNLKRRSCYFTPMTDDWWQLPESFVENGKQ